jgi:hypothetical protein
MMLLIVMLAATSAAVVIDRGLAWWRGTRWLGVARRREAPNRTAQK